MSIKPKIPPSHLDIDTMSGMTEDSAISFTKDPNNKSSNSITGIFSNPMFVYIVRRTLVLIPLWFGISIVTFALIRVSGDPRDQVLSGRNTEAIRASLAERYRLDEPYPVQFYTWLKNFFTWKFGYSGTFKTTDPSGQMNKIIWETAKLQYLALILAIAIAIPIGIIAAKNRNTKTDYTVSTVALLGLSMPIYLTGYILIRIFGGGGLDLLPTGGAGTPFIEKIAAQKFDTGWQIFWYIFKDEVIHLILPLIALTFFQLALIARLIRSSMLEVLNQDYILAARANGISERKIIWKLSLRNAIIPAITFIAISLGTALAGAPITETVFNWPGLGLNFVKSLKARDMAISLGITMIITTFILVSNLIADILYVYIDPRIRV